MLAFFMSSGLFLGWSLGANDASNVFGTAVGSKMIRFKTAAVGEGIFKLSPVAAFVVVFAHSMVLFLFASQRLQHLLIHMGLPPIPLVPVSSSQAIVGAVIGIGLLKGGRGIRWRTLGGISSSWVVTPVIAAVLSFISLFFLQNVFEQEVYRNVKYALTQEAVARIQKIQISVKGLQPFFGQEFANARRIHDLLSKQKMLRAQDLDFILASTKIDNLTLSAPQIDSINRQLITEQAIQPLRELEGRVFKHRWQLEDALAEKSLHWRPKKDDRNHNANLAKRIDYICNIFRSEGN